MSTHHSFNIAQTINKATGQPFGPKYDGSFYIRRPTIGDKKAIALKDAAAMNAYGPINPDHVQEGIRLLAYVETFVTHLAEKELPPWFSLSKLYDETDERAILAVWAEVTAFLDGFRPKEPRQDGGSGE